MCCRIHKAVSSLALSRGSIGANSQDAEYPPVALASGGYMDNAAKERYVWYGSAKFGSAYVVIGEQVIEYQDSRWGPWLFRRI
jgi:hypothetical protein